METNGLAPATQAFVDELLSDPQRNATAAYKRSHPKCKSEAAAQACASRLLSNAKVQEAIAKADAGRMQRVGLTQDWVIERLRHESQLTGEGSSHSARVTALKLLGQHISMFPDRVEHRGTVRVKVSAAEMTDDELLAIASG